MHSTLVMNISVIISRSVDVSRPATIKTRVSATTPPAAGRGGGGVKRPNEALAKKNKTPRISSDKDRKTRGKLFI